MRRLAIAVAALSLLATASTSRAAEPCKRTKYLTSMIHQACVQGGQPEAKNAMKKFMKEKSVKSCNQCHTSLTPDYPLKRDAPSQYKTLGGK